MRLLTLLFIIVFTWNYGKCQETRTFNFIIDSLVLDGTNYFPQSINDNIQVGIPKYYTILKTDTLAIRIRVKLTKRGSQPKKLKIRIDLHENDRWHKAPLFIDIHRFTRFRIRRDQCWMRTSFRYNAGFPIDMDCNCWKPLKGKKSHDFFLGAKAITQ